MNWATLRGPARRSVSLRASLAPLLVVLAALLAPCAVATGLRVSADAGLAKVEATVTPAPDSTTAPAAALAEELLALPTRLADPVVVAVRELPAEVRANIPGPLPPPVPSLLPEDAPFALGPADASVSAGAPPAPTAAQATAVGGLALFWLLLEKLGLGRALVALYFRVQPGELLENERRERVLTLVRERPGIGPTEIAQDLGTAWGVTSYHLDRLERGGLIVSQRMGHHRCYFLPGSVPREQQRTVGMFRVDTTRRVAKLVSERPGIPQSQLCHELGLSASAASKQLSRLEAASLVRRESTRTGLLLYPEPQLAAMV